MLPTAVIAQQSDNELLIDKLVEKGYLSTAEANRLKRQAHQQLVMHDTGDSKLVLSEWVERIEIQGDIRLRYEHQKVKGQPGPNTISRSVGRTRVRVGILATLNKYLRTGVGLATSSSDSNQRSANIDFDGSFGRPDIRLDYAFAEVTPFPWAKAIGGKFVKDDYLWTPTNMLWDRDLNPYGASLHLEKQIHPYINVFANLGSWVIDEQPSSNEDQFLLYAQPGVRYDDNRYDLTASLNMYKFRHLKGFRLEGSSCTNSGLLFSGFRSECDNGNLDYDFRNLGYSFEVGYSKLMQDEFYRIAIFGEYTHNDFGPDDANDAWAAGMIIGHKKISKLWDWQLQFQYTRLERDAFPDAFPDSSRYFGFTGIAGYEGSLVVGLAENANIEFEVQRNQRIDENTDVGELEDPENLYQIDVNMLF